MFEIKPDSVHHKFYRAVEHWNSLNDVLNTHYKGRVAQMQTLERVGEMLDFNTANKIPKRIPLIVGDCLQNMRSSLDYLVWELVKIGKKNDPGQNHMFPICLKRRHYQKALEDQRRLEGVPDEAVAIIDALQPFNLPFPERTRHMLSVLDHLTNVNKHRHIIGTQVENRLEPGDLAPIHFVKTSSYIDSATGSATAADIISYIAFEDGPIARIEIASGLDAIARFLGEGVFPRFEKFFE